MVQIETGPDYPTTAPKTTADVPRPIELLWNSKQSNLLDVIAQYQKVSHPHPQFSIGSEAWSVVNWQSGSLVLFNNMPK